MGIPPLVVAAVVVDRVPHGTFRTPEAGAAGVELGDGVGRADAAPDVAPGDGAVVGTAYEKEGVAVRGAVAVGGGASGVPPADAALGAGVAAVATDLVGAGESDVSVEGPPSAPAQAAKSIPSKPATAALPTRAGVYAGPRPSGPVARRGG